MSESQEPDGPESIAEPTDEPVDEPIEQPIEPEERRYPSTLGGLLYLFVLAGAAVGVLVAWAGDWRLGVRLLAVALLFGALSRLLVPPAQAGMLKVRHRLTDVALLTTVAAILLVLVGSIPD